MSSDDYLLAAVEGLSTGVAHSYLPFAQAKFEDQLTRNRNSQQLKDQLAANVELEKQKLPFQLQLEQGKNADTAKRQLELEQQKDSQLGSDFDPDTQKKLGLIPTQRYRISQINAALSSKTKLYGFDRLGDRADADRQVKQDIAEKNNSVREDIADKNRSIPARLANSFSAGADLLKSAYPTQQIPVSGINPPAAQNSNSSLSDKAGIFLRSNNQADTPANRAHAIQQEWVTN